VTETFAAQQLDAPMVTSASAMLTRWPAPPANVRRAFWPGVVVVTVAEGPPATSISTSSGGTS
jgi:hypothetical protein